MQRSQKELPKATYSHTHVSPVSAIPTTKTRVRASASPVKIQKFPLRAERFRHASEEESLCSGYCARFEQRVQIIDFCICCFAELTFLFFPSLSLLLSQASDSDSDDAVVWYWAGDSDPSDPDKQQDIWVQFAGDVLTKIENAFLKGKRKVIVHAERYVDLTDWQQKRKDDPERKRAVLRSIGPLADLKRSKTTEKKGALAKKSSKSAVASPVVESDEENEDDEDDILDNDDDDDLPVEWQWAGDSKKGKSQDTWVPYDAKATKIVAKGFASGKKKVKLSATHFIEFNDNEDWWQVRYDDEDKRRRVRSIQTQAAQPVLKKKKTEPKKKVAKKVAKKVTKADSLSSSSVSSAPGNLSGIAQALKDSLKYPDGWFPVESMECIEIEVDSNSAEFAAVSALLNKTIAPIHKNNSVNHIIPYSKLECVRLVRVQNPILWVNYHNRSQRIEKKLIEQFGIKTKIPNLEKCLTHSDSPSPLNATTNETFLWHGLNHCHLDTICKDGFNPRFCSLEGMFGSALYFAEHSSKANQYTHVSPCTVVVTILSLVLQL